MLTKVDAVKHMADYVTENLTSEIKDWTKFLLVAGRLFKHPFCDQLLIYAQRVDAKACAEFNIWTKRMNRRIRRGSKGIALLRCRDGRIFLRYVFDVADTECRENSRDPVIWQYRNEHQAAVTARLAECFGVPGGEGLDKQLIGLAVQSGDEHWHDFKDGIMRSVHGSLLDELGEDDTSNRFRMAVTVSLSFLLMSRCGLDLDKYFTPEDFACIRDFNTRDTVLVLGKAVSQSANVILRQIEYAIKKYERDKAAGALPPVYPPELDAQHNDGKDTAAA